MAKFRQLYKLLLDQQIIQPQQIHKPLSISRRDLETIHTRRYHEAFSRDDSAGQNNEGSVCQPRPLVQRTWLAVGGTLLTARLALQKGVAATWRVELTTHIQISAADFAFSMTLPSQPKFF